MSQNKFYLTYSDEKFLHALTSDNWFASVTHEVFNSLDQEI